MTTGGPITRTEDDLAAGTQIGRYRLEDPVGRGGMGTVYRAFDQTTNRNVALKLLAEGIPPSLRERFLAECEAEANIRHEHVMPVYDRGWLTDERPYFVMELVYEPITLGELMDVINSGKLGAQIPRLRAWNDPQRLIADVILPICEGIDVANNEYGIQHRDLKPDNVLIDIRTRRAYLIDFGICRDMDDEKDRGRIVGTPRFLSPEQASAHTHERTDIWGLGALLRYVITGEPPLAGTSPFTRAEVNKRIEALKLAEAKATEAGEDAKARGYGRRREQLEDPTLRVQEDLLRDAVDGVYLPLPEHMSAGLAAVIQKAMAKDPQQRYATAGALVRDLRTWVAGGGVQALHEKSSSGALVDLARRLLNRNNLRVAGALVALVIGLALGTGLFTKTPAPPDHRVEDGLVDLESNSRTWADLVGRGGANKTAPTTRGLVGRFLDDCRGAIGKRMWEAANDEQRAAVEQMLESTDGPVAQPARVEFQGWRPKRWDVTDLTGQAAATGPSSAPQGGLPALLPGVYQVHSAPHGVWLLLTVSGAAREGFKPAPGKTPVRTILLGPPGITVPGDMIWVPAGISELGGDIIVPPFLAGRNFVTNEKYSEWLDDMPAADRAARVPPVGFERRPMSTDPDRWHVVKGMGGKPALGVRPTDAKAYAAWRSAAEGTSIRLPTEREWRRMAAIDRMQDGSVEHLFPWRGAVQWKAKHRRGERDAITPAARKVRSVSPHGVQSLFTGPGEFVLTNDRSGFLIKGKGGMLPMASAAARSEPIEAGDNGHRFGFRVVREP